MVVSSAGFCKLIVMRRGNIRGCSAAGGVRGRTPLQAHPGAAGPAWEPAPTANNRHLRDTNPRLIVTVQTWRVCCTRRHNSRSSVAAGSLVRPQCTIEV